ncbi:MAG: radical SAM protein [Bacillota bacterium]|nr:radical SAM protein [Bacillota bacterium]
MTYIKEGQILQPLLVEAVREHNVLPLTGRCNLSCIFCSHRHNPPDIKAFSFAPLSEGLWSDLAQYLDPGRKIIIGESATRLREGEPFTHPQIYRILERLRLLYPETAIQITTNAALINENALKILATLKPLEMVISLNSATAAGRNLLMNDFRPENALRVLSMMNNYNIPFHGSLVALPHLVGFDDLRKTIVFLDQAGALTVRLLLPGYTAFSDLAVVPPPGTSEILYSFVSEIKSELKGVLLAEPPLIENLDSVVEGVNVNSPAFSAGIMAGDIVTEINGIETLSRVGTFNTLYSSYNPVLTVKRGSDFIKVSSSKKGSESFGLIMNYDLDPDQIKRVKESLNLSASALMLLSKPALKRWEVAADKFDIKNLTFQAVDSLYFGGSINCAGLLTVRDFQQAYNNANNPLSFDNILVPAVAFDSNGQDLSGSSYLNLKTGSIPVTLVT